MTVKLLSLMAATIFGLGVVATVAGAAGRRVIADQSFDVRLAGLGSVRFVSLMDTRNGPSKCRFELRKNGATIYRFPEPYSNTWACMGVQAVAFRDVNRDGAKDVVIIATAITGIGPNGAKPFHANTIYYGTGHGDFLTERKVNEFASAYKTASALIAALRTSPYARIGVK